MSKEKYHIEDIEKVFIEKNINFRFSDFLEALMEKNVERIKMKAAKPKFIDVEVCYIYPAITDGMYIESFIQKHVKEHNDGYFSYFKEDLDDDGAEMIDYIKIGDKFYAAEIHCTAEWYGEWSLRCNLPDKITVKSVKEVTEYTIKKTDPNYIILTIPEAKKEI